MAFTKAYIFASDSQGSPFHAATAEVDGTLGSFRYVPAWLAEGWAYPLDPVNLPLSSKIWRINNAHGVFGVFGVLRDAGPDDWGTRIMLLHNQHAPENELERLLRTSGGGVGCLQFSLSRNRVKTPAPLPDISFIDRLGEVIHRVESKSSLTEDELALIEPGSSLGGARPKVSVQKNNEAWLLKFGRESDMVNMPLLEYASMSFLRERLGLDVPETQLDLLARDRHVFGIKRFDRDVDSPVHFISANSLFNVDKIKAIRDSRKNPYSYVNFATILRKYSTCYERDCRELFMRMLANIVMGNTDDHARNHAMIYDIKRSAWRLAPAYDMLPTIISSAFGKQSLGVGLEGADSTFENALSCCKFFALSNDDAESLVVKVKQIYAGWPDYCLEQGMKQQDVEIIRKFCRA